VFGCSEPITNQTARPDLATLDHGVVDGILLNGYNRAVFDLQMAGTHQAAQAGYRLTHLVDTDSPAIVAQEAPHGMPVAPREAYQDGISLAPSRKRLCVAASRHAASKGVRGQHRHRPLPNSLT